MRLWDLIWLVIVLAMLAMLSPECSGEDKPDRLRYNYQTKEYEYAGSSDRLRYNMYKHDWSYENPKARLRYNPYTKKWGWAR